jgi:hypothetical protein
MARMSRPRTNQNPAGVGEEEALGEEGAALVPAQAGGCRWEIMPG